MLDFNVLAKACPSRDVFAHVTGRWGGLVLTALTRQPRRYFEVRGAVEGVSDRMLIQTLRQLERDGLVLREAQSGNPPVTEYSLTASGERIAAALHRVVDAVQVEMGEVLAAQERFDLEHPNPTPKAPGPTCDEVKSGAIPSGKPE